MSWGVFIPYSLSATPTQTYEVKKGFGSDTIAQDLSNKGIIKSGLFFKFYVLISGNHNRLQAGSYGVSSSMSIYQIVKKMTSGDVVKNTITIIEGWNIKDIGKYLASKNISTQKDFLAAMNQDFGADFSLVVRPARLEIATSWFVG